MPVDTPLLSVGLAVATVVVSSAYLWTTHLEHKVKAAETIGTLQNNLTKREEKLQAATNKLEEQRVELDKLKSMLQSRTKDLDQREAELDRRSKELDQREEDLNAKARAQAQIDADKEASLNDTAKTIDTDMSAGDVDSTSDDNDKNKPSEAAMRIKMIETELQRYVKEAEETELEDPFDEDSLEALKKAALKICYLKKYYDVMADKVIYFPSVQSSIVNYTLIEEAEKFYYEEDDEYPMDLSAGLRSVAATAMSNGESDDIDEEYMDALAQDVEI